MASTLVKTSSEKNFLAFCFARLLNGSDSFGKVLF